jgi:DNA invertase Pin-like site-specific DNA recombinase
LVKDNLMGTVDTSCPVGEFFVRIVLALGELVRKQTAERVEEGIARRKHEGKGWGGKERTDINTALALELLKVRGIDIMAIL